MSSKPILFNTEMVKAILDGRKTQTRRAIKIKNKLTRDWAITTGVEWLKVDLKDEKYPYSIREQNGAWNEYSLQDFIKKYSQYQVGDVLWVREPAKVIEINDYQDCFTFKYLADNKEETLSYLDKWENKDGMTVPRWVENCQGVPNGCIKEMARIFLKVTNVRVERLQDMNMYEETGSLNIFKHKKYYDNWNSTAKDGYKWEDNPYVFVYEFERIHDV